jgi:tellurite resistance protein TehA-like permease
VRLAQLGLGTRELHPGWIVVMMGGIVLPTGGIALGQGELSRAAFLAGALAGLLLVVPLFRAAPLQERLRPTWFILLAPFSLLYVHGAALFHQPAFDLLFYAAIPVLGALLAYARTIHRWGFGPTWWSITFPLDAFALAAARYARENGGAGWRALAGFAIVLATLAVATLIIRSVAEFARRRADARVQ